MNLRLLYWACPIAIAATFGIGLLVFPPRAEQAPVATQPSSPVWLTCASATTGGCLSALPGRDIEVVPDAAPVAVAVQAVPATTAEEPPISAEAPALPAEPATRPVVAAAPPSPAEVVPPPSPAEAAPSRAPAPRHAAIPDSKVRQPAAKKTARREPAARRLAGEAREAVRRFGDDLRDIPVSSYVGGGPPRNVVIRPTNIQDVYYYSRPR